jgi:FtsH-binding integral membrane protein
MSPIAPLAVAPLDVEQGGGGMGTVVGGGAASRSSVAPASAVAGSSGVVTVVGMRVPAEASGGASWETFETHVRHGFVRKVFLIVTLQLAVTFGWVVAANSSRAVSSYLLSNAWVHYLGVSLLVCSLFAMCCVDLRVFPNNYAVLTLFTVGEALVLGRQLMFVDTELLLLAMGLTVGVCAGLTLFALQTRWDITGWGWYLFSGLLVLMLFGLFGALFRSVVVFQLYVAGGVLLFSFYLVYDVQMLLGGKRDAALDVDDYVFAALTIYLDVINIFIYILSLLQTTNRN